MFQSKLFAIVVVHTSEAMEEKFCDILSHFSLVTIGLKKKPYNNINIWRYRHKGGDISASTRCQACGYAVVRRADEAEKAEYDSERCSHIA